MKVRRPMGWLWRRLRYEPLPRTKAAIGALVLVLIAGGVTWGISSRLGPDSCASHGEMHEGQCIAVSDGSYVFDPSLAQVSDRIHTQNTWVEGQPGPHASIAMMVPLTMNDPVVREQIRHEVQGAYLAVYRANHESGGERPLVRLLLANPGRDQNDWPVVDRRLGALSRDSGVNLRAVVGFDLSTSQTKAAIADLTNHRHIPVVGGPITSDTFANTKEHPDRFDGLARVVPTNGDQAKALATFSKWKAQNSLVVEDRRNDDYVNTLKRAFHERTENAPLEPETYESTGLGEEGTLSNDFHQMATDICQNPEIKVIYFAGRPVHMRQFVNELGTRPCQNRQYTVLTGSGASTLALDKGLKPQALRRGVHVQYASVGHPDAWNSPGAPSTGGSAKDVDVLKDLVKRGAAGPVGPIGESNLDDSRTISAYDSAWTAISGLRHQTGGETHVKMPSLEQLGNSWNRLHGTNRVNGASGWICLDNYGNPYDKAVSVVELVPDGKDHVKIKFAGLAWPEGKPPSSNCSIPNHEG